MTATVLETLSAEDLERWRDASARYHMFSLPGFRCGVSDAGEIQRFIYAYYKLAAELLDKNGIFDSEAVEATISPFTGAIFIGEGE